MNLQKIKEVLRNPSLIFGVAGREDGGGKECHPSRTSQMHTDICLALEADPSNSPAADDARREMGAQKICWSYSVQEGNTRNASQLRRNTAGLRYEQLLSKQLEAQGLFFWTEDALRAKGYFKTPDAKLQVFGARALPETRRHCACL